MSEAILVRRTGNIRNVKWLWSRFTTQLAGTSVARYSAAEQSDMQIAVFYVVERQFVHVHEWKSSD